MIWYESDNPNGYVTGKTFSIDKPCVTVMAAGMGGDSYGHWHLHSDGRPMTLRLRHNSKINPRQNGMNLDKEPLPTVMTSGISAFGDYWIEQDGKNNMTIATDKPPYEVPSMETINALPWNGLKVASTFSGCGGSCLGYRMAGFKVVWANEFVPAAQASYNANKADDCFLDCRDICTVTAEEILEQTKLKKGELDLFDGSPPCQAFSTAGKRHKNWGKKKQYEHGAKQCNEQLFDEYIRLVQGLQPKVFVAENVSGLIKGTAKGMFLEILAGLKACGYRVRCKVVDAQWLGVPQQRQRTIFVGVREDLEKEPAHPKPLAYRYSVRDALPWIASLNNHPYVGGESWKIQDNAETKPAPTVGCGPNNTMYVRHEVSRYRTATRTKEQWVPANKPYSTVGTAASFGNNLNGTGGQAEFIKDGQTERRKFTIAELKRICAFPDDFTLLGSYSQQWERLGNSVPPVMMAAIASTIRDEVLL